MSEWNVRDAMRFSEIKRGLAEAMKADLHDGQMVIDVEDVEFLIKHVRKGYKLALKASA